MRVLVVGDEVGAREVVSALEGAGHVAVPWKPSDQSTGDVVPVAVVRGGVELVNVVLGLGPAIHVVAVVTPDDVDELPRAVADFAVEPLSSKELILRVDRLATQESKAQAVMSRLLFTAVQAAEDIVELTDSKAVIRYVNPAFERVLGWTLEEAVGKTPGQLIRSDVHDGELFAEISETLESGNVWSGMLVSRARDQRLVYLETTLSPVLDDAGNVTHHVGVKRDITRRLAEEQELAEAIISATQARDEAVAANKSKSEFLASMSHELRTPLNAILGYSELLQEDADEEGMSGISSDLGRIIKSGRHLLSLINDVLDMSKIEAGRMEICNETFDIDELVDEAVGTFAPLTNAAGNSLRVEGAGQLGELYGDRVKLRQVLFNLLSNANKFTHDGVITVEVSRDESGGVLRLQVSDTGIGIADDVQSRLFQPFVQADSSTTREYGGTGLGLVITKRLCELMGGNIDLVSEVGRGTRLTVRLPLKAPSEPCET